MGNQGIKQIFIRIGLSICVVVLSSATSLLAAGNLQLLSARGLSFNPAEVANAASDLPIISSDGRYVLFASAADNLVTNQNTGPLSGLVSHPLNVFIRDRVSGTTRLVSANFTGGGGNGDSFPADISTNGQFVLFESAASDLVPGDTNSASDVFLRDLASGLTTLVSTRTNGAVANGPSRNPVMTPDARYVAFVSSGSNLVANDTNGIADVFVRDQITTTTTLASVGARSTGSVTLPAASDVPDITPDGRFVAFFSTATNLVPNTTSAGQIYVRNLAENKTIWVSSNAPAIYQTFFGSLNVISCNHKISSDGNYVAFEACTNAPSGAFAAGIILRQHLTDGTTDIVSTNANVPLMQFEDINTLDMTPDGRFIAFVSNTNGGFGSATGIYLWDAQTSTTTWISQSRNNGVTAGDSCNWPRIAADGRYVSFLTSATNLTTNSVTGHNFYLRDTQANQTKLLNVAASGLGSVANPWTPPVMSADGRYIAFTCADGNLVANDSNQATDVFVRDMLSATSELVSLREFSLPDAAANGTSGFSFVTTSSNGLYVAFASDANNLCGNDTNGLRDVFVRDVLNATNILASKNTNGVAAAGFSTAPAISSDGRYVAFSSSANDLVAGDTNNAMDVFVHDLQTSTTALISKNSTGTGLGNGDSSAPRISADGRFVLFSSTANNLTAGTFNSQSLNLFLRDRQLATNYALTFYAGGYSASMTPDGGRIAYIGFIDSAVSPARLFVWDSFAAKRIYTNNLGASLSYASISPNGQRVACLEPQLKVIDLMANTTTTISSGSFTPNPKTDFSTDGQLLVYSTTGTNSTADTNAKRDVYLYNFQTGTNTLISRNSSLIAAANDASDSPEISPDGRFIAYRSIATNNAGTDQNEVPDLFLYDRLTSTNARISASVLGNWTANNRSLAPVFSDDSKSLIFTSWGSDLLRLDYNGRSDVFGFTLPAPPALSTDGDAMDDAWETLYFNTLSRNGTDDFDNDGASDLQEFLAGTNPADSASVFRVQLLPLNAFAPYPSLTWPAVPGKFYRIQFKNDLSEPAWEDFTGNVILDGNAGYALDLTPADSKRFYRVLVNN